MSDKGFFAVSVPVLRRIVEQGGDASDLMTFLVLAKHTTGWGKWKYIASTAGAKAVSARTGLTYRKAQVRLDWLQEHGFIQPGESVEGMPAHVTCEAAHQRTATKVRWVLGKLGNSRAYLSHSLIDGVGAGKKHPPLMRLWEEVAKGPCASIMEARTDALLLLIHCYAEQSIQDFGGINPEVLRRPWTDTTSATEEVLEDLGWLVMEVEQGQESTTLEFVAKVLSHAPEDSRRDRFWNAFENLKRLGFMYEVLQVWQGNPLENPRAELFYSLYVRDYHARQSDPYCQGAIHTFLIEAGYLDGNCLNALVEEAKEQQTFRLIRTKGGGECVIGTYRLRFRPSTEDTGKGMMQEAERAEHWRDVLTKAAYERQPQ